MTASELMQAMADAGAPLEAIILAVRALDERDAEIKARDAVAAEKRAVDAERKRISRASTDIPRTKRGRVQSAPNDIYSNPENPSEAKASPSPTVETRLVEEWNSGPAANGARKAAKLDASRKNLLRSRLKDHGEEEVFAALRNLGRSKFHCGENDRGWRANLGWFLEAKNFLKALEMGDAKPMPAVNGKVLTGEEQRAYVEHVSRKFGRMAPETPAGPAAKPITFASIAAQAGGHH